MQMAKGSFIILHLIKSKTNCEIISLNVLQSLKQGSYSLKSTAVKFSPNVTQHTCGNLQMNSDTD